MRKILIAVILIVETVVCTGTPTSFTMGSGNRATPPAETQTATASSTDAMADYTP